MKMTTQAIRQHLERQKGRKSQIQETLTKAKEDLELSRRDLRRHEQAREVIREVGLKTQQQLSFHISDITSLALESVFNDPYTLKVDFVQRRNKTECDLLFVRDEMEIDPIEASGIGAVDVAAFALRIAAWSMKKPRTRATILLDEPFKHLKGKDANHRVLNMINEISKRMGIQIIMVSDERIPKEDIISSADRVFEVGKRRNKSYVKQL